MTTFLDIEKIKQKADSSVYSIAHLGIKSNAIPYQRHFLSKEDLTLKPSQKEFFVP